MLHFFLASTLSSDVAQLQKKPRRFIIIRDSIPLQSREALEECIFPTTPGLTSDDQSVQAALAALGRVVGKGTEEVDFVLPVRPFTGRRYFAHDLFITPSVQAQLAGDLKQKAEPNFWDSSSQPNLALAEYYEQFFYRFAFLLNGTAEQKVWAEEQMREKYPAFMKAYEEGKLQKAAAQVPSQPRPIQQSPQPTLGFHASVSPSSASFTSTRLQRVGSETSAASRGVAAAKSDISNLHYSYTLNDLHTILKANRLLEEVIYLKQPRIYAEGAGAELRQAIAKAFFEEKSPHIIFINIAKHRNEAAHWIFLFVQPNVSKREDGKFLYFDPLKDPVDTKILDAFPEEIPGRIGPSLLKVERRTESLYDSGPLVAEVAKRQIRGESTSNTDNALQLRREHAQYFPDEPQRVIFAPILAPAKVQASVLEIKTKLKAARGASDQLLISPVHCEVAPDANGWRIDFPAAVQAAQNYLVEKYRGRDWDAPGEAVKQNIQQKQKRLSPGETRLAIKIALEKEEVRAKYWAHLYGRITAASSRPLPLSANISAVYVELQDEFSKIFTTEEIRAFLELVNSIQLDIDESIQYYSNFADSAKRLLSEIKDNIDTQIAKQANEQLFLQDPRSFSEIREGKEWEVCQWLPVPEAMLSYPLLYAALELENKSFAQRVRAQFSVPLSFCIHKVLISKGSEAVPETLSVWFYDNGNIRNMQRYDLPFAAYKALLDLRGMATDITHAWKNVHFNEQLSVNTVGVQQQLVQANFVQLQEVFSHFRGAPYLQLNSAIDSVKRSFTGTEKSQSVVQTLQQSITPANWSASLTQTSTAARWVGGGDGQRYALNRTIDERLTQLLKEVVVKMPSESAGMINPILNAIWLQYQTLVHQPQSREQRQNILVALNTNGLGVFLPLFSFLEALIAYENKPSKKDPARASQLAAIKSVLNQVIQGKLTYQQFIDFFETTPIQDPQTHQSYSGVLAWVKDTAGFRSGLKDIISRQLSDIKKRGVPYRTPLSERDLIASLRSVHQLVSERQKMGENHFRAYQSALSAVVAEVTRAHNILSELIAGQSPNPALLLGQLDSVLQQLKRTKLPELAQVQKALESYYPDVGLDLQRPEQILSSAQIESMQGDLQALLPEVGPVQGLRLLANSVRNYQRAFFTDIIPSEVNLDTLLKEKADIETEIQRRRAASQPMGRLAVRQIQIEKDITSYQKYLQNKTSVSPQEIFRLNQQMIALNFSHSTQVKRAQLIALEEQYGERAQRRMESLLTGYQERMHSGALDQAQIAYATKKIRELQKELSLAPQKRIELTQLQQQLHAEEGQYRWIEALGSSMADNLEQSIIALLPASNLTIPEQEALRFDGEIHHLYMQLLLNPEIQGLSRERRSQLLASCNAYLQAPTLEKRYVLTNLLLTMSLDVKVIDQTLKALEQLSANRLQVFKNFLFSELPELYAQEVAAWQLNLNVDRASPAELEARAAHIFLTFGNIPLLLISLRDFYKSAQLNEVAAPFVEKLANFISTPESQKLIPESSQETFLQVMYWRKLRENLNQCFLADATPATFENLRVFYEQQLQAPQAFYQIFEQFFLENVQQLVAEQHPNLIAFSNWMNEPQCPFKDYRDRYFGILDSAFREGYPQAVEKRLMQLAQSSFQNGDNFIAAAVSNINEAPLAQWYFDNRAQVLTSQAPIIREILTRQLLQQFSAAQTINSLTAAWKSFQEITDQEQPLSLFGQRLFTARDLDQLQRAYFDQQGIFARTMEVILSTAFVQPPEYTGEDLLKFIEESVIEETYFSASHTQFSAFIDRYVDVVIQKTLEGNPTAFETWKKLLAQGYVSQLQCRTGHGEIKVYKLLETNMLIQRMLDKIEARHESVTEVSYSMFLPYVKTQVADAAYPYHPKFIAAMYRFGDATDRQLAQKRRQAQSATDQDVSEFLRDIPSAPDRDWFEQLNGGYFAPAVEQNLAALNQQAEGYIIVLIRKALFSNDDQAFEQLKVMMSQGYFIRIWKKEGGQPDHICDIVSAVHLRVLVCQALVNAPKLPSDEICSWIISFCKSYKEFYSLPWSIDLIEIIFTKKQHDVSGWIAPHELAAKAHRFTLRHFGDQKINKPTPELDRYLLLLADQIQAHPVIAPLFDPVLLPESLTPEGQQCWMNIYENYLPKDGAKADLVFKYCLTSEQKKQVQDKKSAEHAVDVLSSSFAGAEVPDLGRVIEGLMTNDEYSFGSFDYIRKVGAVNGIPTFEQKQNFLKFILEHANKYLSGELIASLRQQINMLGNELLGESHTQKPSLSYVGFNSPRWEKLLNNFALFVSIPPRASGEYDDFIKKQLPIVVNRVNAFLESALRKAKKEASSLEAFTSYHIYQFTCERAIGILMRLHAIDPSLVNISELEKYRETALEYVKKMLQPFSPVFMGRHGAQENEQENTRNIQRLLACFDLVQGNTNPELSPQVMSMGSFFLRHALVNGFFPRHDEIGAFHYNDLQWFASHADKLPGRVALLKSNNRDSDDFKNAVAEAYVGEPVAARCVNRLRAYLLACPTQVVSPGGLASREALLAILNNQETPEAKMIYIFGQLRDNVEGLFERFRPDNAPADVLQGMQQEIRSLCAYLRENNVTLLKGRRSPENSATKFTKEQLVKDAQAYSAYLIQKGNLFEAKVELQALVALYQKEPGLFNMDAWWAVLQSAMVEELRALTQMEGLAARDRALKEVEDIAQLISFAFPNDAAQRQIKEWQTYIKDLTQSTALYQWVLNIIPYLNKKLEDVPQAAIDELVAYHVNDAPHVFYLPPDKIKILREAMDRVRSSDLCIKPVFSAIDQIGNFVKDAGVYDPAPQQITVDGGTQTPLITFMVENAIERIKFLPQLHILRHLRDSFIPGVEVYFQNKDCIPKGSVLRDIPGCHTILAYLVQDNSLLTYHTYEDAARALNVKARENEELSRAMTNISQWFKKIYGEHKNEYFKIQQALLFLAKIMWLENHPQADVAQTVMDILKQNVAELRKRTEEGVMDASTNYLQKLNELSKELMQLRAAVPLATRFDTPSTPPRPSSPEDQERTTRKHVGKQLFTDNADTRQIVRPVPSSVTRQEPGVAPPPDRKEIEGVLATGPAQHNKGPGGR